MAKINWELVNWEKIGIYIAIMIGFLSVVNILFDVKERISKLEVKVDYLEQ